MADQARKARAAALEDKKRRLEELKARRARRELTPIDQPKPSENLNEYIDGLLKQSTPIQIAEEELRTPSQPSHQSEDEPLSLNVSCASSSIVSDATEQGIPTTPSTLLPKPESRKVEVFEFGTQTLEEDFPNEEEEEDPVDANKMDENDGGDVNDDGESCADNGKELIEVNTKVMSNEEKREAVSKVPFSSFLNTASKKVERILGAPVLADLLVNFVGEGDGNEDDNAKAKPDGSRFLSARQVFEHQKWTTRRNVTDMDWSPLHRELMLSSYDMPGTSNGSHNGGLLSSITPNVPPSSSLAPRSGELKSDGLALVWNLAMPQRPEHIFTCGSPVLSARFHPTESPLVIGGCHSGQLVIWDIRAGRLPCQRSGQGYPICAMQVTDKPVGLVTASTDGKVSFWSLANLRDPAETIQLDGNLSSLGTAPANAVFCGDESGSLFHIPVKRKQAKKLPNPNHFGMVTGVSVKKKLVLSSGVDWTVQLSKNGKVLWNVISNSYEYMSDVQWSPVHPSLLATSSSSGVVGLWNLADSLEEPAGEIVVESGVGLNKIRWSTDGKRILVAAAERVHILSLTDDAIRQKEDDEDRMLNRLI